LTEFVFSGWGIVAGPCACGNVLSKVLISWTFLTNAVIRSYSIEFLVHAVIFLILHLILHLKVKEMY
jgi:hypothetical protein